MTTLSLEQEVKTFLSNKHVKFDDNSASFKNPDFTVFWNDIPYFYLEVKEKRQKYDMSNWPEYTEETDLFILDDLTVRKCLAYSPKSGIMIRDNLRNAYFFLSVVDLALMPRMRVNRPIERNVATLKGKWLINLNNSLKSESIDEIFSGIRKYVGASEEILFNTIECYGHYVEEKIGLGGITRRPAHWDTDIKLTR